MMWNDPNIVKQLEALDASKPADEAAARFEAVLDEARGQLNSPELSVRTTAKIMVEVLPVLLEIKQLSNARPHSDGDRMGRLIAGVADAQAMIIAALISNTPTRALPALLDRAFGDAERLIRKSEARAAAMKREPPKP